MSVLWVLLPIIISSHLLVIACPHPHVCQSAVFLKPTPFLPDCLCPARKSSSGFPLSSDFDQSSMPHPFTFFLIPDVFLCSLGSECLSVFDHAWTLASRDLWFELNPPASAPSLLLSGPFASSFTSPLCVKAYNIDDAEHLQDRILKINVKLNWAPHLMYNKHRTTNICHSC